MSRAHAGLPALPLTLHDGQKQLPGSRRRILISMWLAINYNAKKKIMTSYLNIYLSVE